MDTWHNSWQLDRNQKLLLIEVLNLKYLIMKNHFFLALLSVSLLWGCNQTDGEYTDLKTGKTVVIEKDGETGYMVNKETRKPVYLYVDASHNDTFYGRTGKVINGDIVTTSGGDLSYNGDGDYVYKNGDYKLKVEADGDMKEKEGDAKIKVDEDGDYKIKDGDYKKKVEADGDIKIKDGNKKIKISEDGETKIKIDN
jgi:hypothetical protein